VSNTSEMRKAWAPACKPHPRSLRPAYVELDAVFKKWGYAPRAGVTGSFNCRPITGGTGYSLHAYEDGGSFTFWSGTTVTMALACDVNWDKNPYGSRLVTDMPRGMVNEIVALRTLDNLPVWGWGGFYSGNKDAMHFEVHCTPAQLARGIRPSVNPPHPNPGGSPLARAWKKILHTPAGDGYWIFNADGSVRPYGAAKDHGQAAGVTAHPVVAAAVTPTGDGYWLFAEDGGVFAYGDAGFEGSLGDQHLNAPIIDAVSAPDGHGYWMLGGDGGVFAFGSAQFFGAPTGS
jgi:hypothetical protein